MDTVNLTAPKSGVSLWSKAIDVFLGVIPALCLAPTSLFGLVFGGFGLFGALAKGNVDWYIIILSLCIVLGFIGWIALFTAIIRRWQGKLFPVSRRLKVGLYCALIYGIFFSYFLIALNQTSDQSFYEMAHGYIANPVYLYIVISPAILTVIYLYRISSQSKPHKI